MIHGPTWFLSDASTHKGYKFITGGGLGVFHNNHENDQHAEKKLERKILLDPGHINLKRKYYQGY